MIKKLRLKFILINMSLVTLVLIIVFSVLCYSNYQRLQVDSHNAMEMKILRESNPDQIKIEFGKNGLEKPFSNIPVICIVLDDMGQILTVIKDDVEISSEVLSTAVDQVLASNKAEGILSSLDLRFMIKMDRGKIKIALADRSNEHNSMTTLIFTSLLVGAGGFIAFFFISYFLSNWVLRPVERAWKQQRQFVADASHELKTPLTVILANTNILLSHKKEPIEKQIKWVEYIQAEADRMKHLIDDMLYLAKSDAVRDPSLKRRLCLSDIVWSCVLPFESIAFEQNITLESSISPDISIIGDEGQLKRLVIILLDNACKYVEANGSVSVRLESYLDKIKLMINNSGSSIPQKHLPYLFERFYRSDQSRSREQGGYGLGLSIAKSIVENHKGKISIDSNEMYGTTFTVTLPLKQSPIPH